jgi:hypothetical protein
MQIYPRCKLDWAQVYISAEGDVMPCCWIGTMPHLKKYLEFNADCLDKLNIKNRPLDEILKDPDFSRIEKSWADESVIFSPCMVFWKNEMARVKSSPLTWRKM